MERDAARLVHRDAQASLQPIRIAVEEITIGRTRGRTILLGVFIFIVVVSALWFVVGRRGPSKIPHVGPAGDKSAPSGPPAPH